MKKIVILNRGPRLNGNTQALIQSFTKGAKETGNEVIQFNLQTMHIHGCLGCMKGGKDLSSPCVQKDDMNQIYPNYQKCDVIVLASPMYYWGFTGQLKCAFDRLFAVAECNENYQNPKKDVLLLMASEGDSQDNAKPVQDYYLSLVNHLNWNNLGMIIAGGNMNIGDISNHPQQLKQAYDLGKSIH